MASFDAASKKQVETNPQDFVDLCFKFGLANITVLEAGLFSFQYFLFYFSQLLIF